MATKTRVPSKLIWATEDIVAEVNRGERVWSKALDRVRSRFPDPALFVALAELRDILAAIRVLATDARHGQYHGGGGG